MDTQILFEAARAGSTGLLHKLLKENPLILTEVSLSSFKETPLHVAIKAGQLDFVGEIVKLKPEFGQQVSKDGFRPIDIAAVTGHLGIVRALLKIDQNIGRLKGKDRRTALHYAAANGRVEVLDELLFTCSESVMDVTVYGETALHLALKNNQFEAFSVLVNWLERINMEEVINWGDCDGNTVLHLAATRKQFECVELLLIKKNAFNGKLEVNATNSKKLTAMDVLDIMIEDPYHDIQLRKIFQQAGALGAQDATTHSSSSSIQKIRKNDQTWHELPSASLKDWFKSSKFWVQRDSPSDTRNALLVMATLIASVTFLAGVTYRFSIDSIIPRDSLTYALLAVSFILHFMMWWLPSWGKMAWMQRNSRGADRWQCPTNFQQKSSIPSPQTLLQVMHKAEKKDEVVVDEEVAKQRQFKAILNKLTSENSEQLIEQVKAVNIDNAITLTGVVSQIFEKALMKPTFCEMYVNLCDCLVRELPGFSEDNEKITFKRLLINKCQYEFESRGREQEEADKVEQEVKIIQSGEEIKEKRIKAQRRMLGTVRLIGELYKKKILNEPIIHACIRELLGQSLNPDEEDIEALCILISTIGEVIDNPKGKLHMDAYFDKMEMLSNNMKLSSKVRFMLKDAIDLRNNKWQQRRKAEELKKIDQELHRDAAREQQAQVSRLARSPANNLSARTIPMDFGPGGSAIVSSPNSQNVPSEKVWLEESLRDMSMAAIKEFGSARDEKEAALCIKDLISQWLTESSERNETEMAGSFSKASC